MSLVQGLFIVLYLLAVFQNGFCEDGVPKVSNHSTTLPEYSDNCELVFQVNKSCVNSFEDLQKSIFCNQNHKRLGYTFFPHNSVPPSYVQVSYKYFNDSENSYNNCSKERCDNTVNNNDDKTWLWAYSPVYLVFHPEALNALSLSDLPLEIDYLNGKKQNKKVFSQNYGGQFLCLCIPMICSNVTKKSEIEMFRNLTALLYGYANVQKVEQVSLENIWYAILISELRKSGPNKSQDPSLRLPRLIFIFTAISNISLNIVLVPLIAYLFNALNSRVKLKRSGTLLLSSLWWAAAITMLYMILISNMQNEHSFCWEGSNCNHATMPLSKATYGLRLLIPFIGYIIATFVGIRLERRLNFPFVLQVIITVIQLIHHKSARIVSKAIQYFGLWVILNGFHMLCSHLQFVVFASFDNPFRVSANVSAFLSILLLIFLTLTNICMVDMMITELIFTRQLHNIKKYYLKQLFQFVQITICAVLFSVWLYCFCFVGVYQRNDFVDGLQAVLEFFTVPMAIAILGYAVKQTVYKMNQIAGA